MKRAAGIIMSAVMVLIISSCSLFDIPSEKSDGTFEIALEDTKKETIATTDGYTKEVAANIRLPGDIDLDLEEAVAATVAGFGCGYKDFLNLEYMESSLADKNMEKSIRNYAHVWHSEGWPKSDGTSEDVDVNFYVFELDTSSDEYAALETGGIIDFFYPFPCVPLLTIPSYQANLN